MVSFCYSVWVCGVRLVHPFFTYPGYNVEIPAVAGIDLIAKPSLVIDVRNKAVYSHHRARLESASEEYPDGPSLLAEDVATIVPVQASATRLRLSAKHQSTQTEQAMVSQDYGDLPSYGISAPSVFPSDAPERPVSLAPSTHPPLAQRPSRQFP